jgi:geranylgeranyl diphosphate synthase type II
MFELKPYLVLHKSLIEKALVAYTEQLTLSDRMKLPMQYALMAGGKRLRPILCLSACTAVGGDQQVALPAACALEMIHTYSLIHDDLPALDNDSLRRGKPTCHVHFDEATAILSGDALLTASFEILSAGGTVLTAEDHDVTNIGKWLKIIQIISTAAGCRGMIEGQSQDLAFEGIKLDQEKLQNLHSLKTGALIRASVQSGAILGHATQNQFDRLTTYSELIGLAFQVIDDVLNEKGDPELLGKAVGTDRQRQKNTYPALLGLSESESYARELIDNALQALVGFDSKADPLRAIASYIIKRNR